MGIAGFRHRPASAIVLATIGLLSSLVPASAGCVNGRPLATDWVCSSAIPSIAFAPTTASTYDLQGASVAGAMTITGFANANVGVAMDSASTLGGGLAISTQNGTITTTTPNGTGLSGQISASGAYGIQATATGTNAAISITTSAGSSVAGALGGINAATDGGNTLNLVTNGTVSSSAGGAIATTTANGTNRVGANAAVNGINFGIKAFATGSGQVAIDGTGNVKALAGYAIDAESGTGAVSVTQSGTLTGMGGVYASTGGSGRISVTTTGAMNANATGVTARSVNGDISVSVGAGGLSAALTGVSAAASGSGNVTVSSVGPVATTTGIALGASSASGNLIMTSVGTVSGGTGMSAATGMTGTITVTTTGAVSGTYADALDTQAADGATQLNIGAGGLAGTRNGLVATATGAGTIKSTIAGNVSGAGGDGIIVSANTGYTQTDIASTSIVSGGAGVRLSSTAGDSIVNNAGTISGSGDGGVVAVMGTGALSINNNGLISGVTAALNTSGNVTLNNNTLGVTDGAILGDATTTVNNFGVWKNASGSSVGTLISTGTIGFGSVGAFGTISVAGNATFGVTSLTTIRIGANGMSDTIVVGGTTTINGGTITLVGNGDTYLKGTRYTILTSTGALTGNFSIALANLSTLLPILSYGSGNVYVSLAQFDYRALAATRNQFAAATMIAAAPNTPLTAGGAQLINNLNQGTPDQVRSALTLIAGDGLTATRTIALRQGSMFMDTIGEQEAFWRSRDVVDPNGITIGLPQAASAYAETGWYTGRPSPIRVRPAYNAPSPERSWRMWVSGFGGEHAASGNNLEGSANQTGHLYGGAVGLDAQLNRNLLVGMAAGYSVGNFSVGDRATSGQVDGAHFALYSSFTAGALYGNINFAYTSFSNTTTRTIATPILPQEQEQGNFHSNEARLRLEAGSRIGLGGVGSITTFTAVQVAALTNNAYVESGVSTAGIGSMGLSVASHTTASVPVEIGFRADAQLRMGLATLTPWAQVALVHEFFNSRDQYASLTAIPDTPQRVYGARTARDTLQLKGGAQFSLTRTAALFVSGEADLAPGQHIFSGKGGFRYGW